MVQILKQDSEILSSTQESGSSHSESSSGFDLGGTLATSSDHENSDANLPDQNNAPQTPHECRMPMQADRLPRCIEHSDSESSTEARSEASPKTRSWRSWFSSAGVLATPPKTNMSEVAVISSAPESTPPRGRAERPCGQRI